MRSHLAAFLLSFFKFILVPKNKYVISTYYRPEKKFSWQTFIVRLLQFIEQKVVKKLYSVEYFKILALQ